MNDAVAETAAPAPEAAPVEPTTEVTTEPTSNWRDLLPADLRDNPTIADTPDVATLAKRLIDSRSQLGNSLRLPGEDASAEDRQAFNQRLIDKNLGLMPVPNGEDAEAMESVYQALGRPEDASGYTMPEQWAGVDEQRFGFLAAEAHKAGLSKQQFNQLANTIAAADNEIYSQALAERESGIHQLQGEWGNAFTQKTDRALITAKQLEAPAALIQALENKAVDADTLRWLDKVAAKFGGEGKGVIDDQHMVSEHTPTELHERMAEITKTMLNMDVSDPNYQNLLQKRIKYAKMLANEE